MDLFSARPSRSDDRFVASTFIPQKTFKIIQALSTPFEVVFGKATCDVRKGNYARSQVKGLRATGCTYAAPHRSSEFATRIRALAAPMVHAGIWPTRIIAMNADTLAIYLDS